MHRLTNVAGSSNVLCGGIVSYSSRTKKEILGVSATILERDGEVSAQTARLMARGARLLCRADVGVGVTGYAGPPRQEDPSPVGTVFMGISDRRGDSAWGHSLPGPREEIKALASQIVLDRVRRRVLGLATPNYDSVPWNGQLGDRV